MILVAEIYEPRSRQHYELYIDISGSDVKLQYSDSKTTAWSYPLREAIDHLKKFDLRYTWKI